MNHLRIFILLLLASTLFAPGLAYATDYSVVFCFKYEVSYTDRSGGDWWNTTDDKTARGVRARVIRNSDDAYMYYAYTNSSTGCTSALTLSSNQTYTIRLYSQATLANGNEVHVKDNILNAYHYTVSVDSSYVPSANATETYTWTLSPSYVSNIAAAAGYSLNKRYGGLANNEFVAYTQSCPIINSSTSCSSYEHDAVFFNDFGKTYKFIIAHEMGHHVGMRRDEMYESGNDGPVCNTAANHTICVEHEPTTHDFISKEYQTAAAVEGFAHFYAASVWNDTSETDCQFYYYKKLDWTRETPQVEMLRGNYDCESGGDYLTEYCTGTLSARGTEFDWLRFWWDIMTDVGVSAGEIIDIYDSADPNDWAAYNVYSRIRTAASDSNYISDMDDWDDYANWNGVER